MNTRNNPGTPPSYRLPMLAPRESWPTLIEHAATALEGRCMHDSETLAVELHQIAKAMLSEVQS